MVGHHHVHHVLGAPPRHVATGAVLYRRPRVGRPLRAAFAARRFLVASQAGLPVVGHLLGRLHLAVRVVAGKAGKRAGAAAEAGALLEPVGMVVDLETFAALLPHLLGVDRHQVVGELFARPEAVILAAEAAHPDQADRRLQMALVTNLAPPLGSEPRRVDDAFGDLRRPRFATGHQLDVRGPGAVATLAADTLRQLGREGRQGGKTGFRPLFLRVGVVAEQAFAAHPPRNLHVVGAVVAGRHRPGLLLRIPGERQLESSPLGVR